MIFHAMLLLGFHTLVACTEDTPASSTVKSIEKKVKITVKRGQSVQVGPLNITLVDIVEAVIEREGARSRVYSVELIVEHNNQKVEVSLEEPLDVFGHRIQLERPLNDGAVLGLEQLVP